MIFTKNVTETIGNLAIGNEPFNERDRLVLSFPIYDIPSVIQDDILEAYDYYVENPDKYDGTTGADEQWASIFEPASMRHDLDYQTMGGTFYGRLYSDLKFLDIKKRYKVSSIWRYTQYYAVRWGGYLFQLTNWAKGNTMDIPFEKQFIAPKRTLTQKLVEWAGMITVLPFMICFVGAIVMHIKHKLSIGFKPSIKWFIEKVYEYLKLIK